MGRQETLVVGAAVGLLVAASLAGAHRTLDKARKEVCGGLAVFVYRDLPTPFPEASGPELLQVSLNESAVVRIEREFGVPCVKNEHGACAGLQNWGRGKVVSVKDTPPMLLEAGVPLHAVYQNSIQWLFTGHALAHCVVDDPAEADVFIVPYSLVSLLRAVRSNLNLLTTMAEHHAAVKRHLAAQPAWQRCGGCDHVIGIGKPVQDLGHPEMVRFHGLFSLLDDFWTQTTVLSHHVSDLHGGPREIGRPKSPKAFKWHAVSMPWPSQVQPRSDADVEALLAYVADESIPRSPDAVLEAKSRPHRVKLLELCAADDTPCHIGKGLKMKTVFRRYRSFTYALHPGGDTPTRRGFFDSLGVGCIPIIFDEASRIAGRTDGMEEPPSHHYRKAYARYFKELGWGEDWLDKVALVAEDEDDAMRLIRETPPARVAELQANIRTMIPTLLYWDHTVPLDAEAGEKYQSQGVMGRAMRMLSGDARRRSGRVDELGGWEPM